MFEKFMDAGLAGKMLWLMGRIRQLRLGELPHQDFDLSLSQLDMLMYVGRNPGSHLQDVAAGLDLTSPTVSVGIRRLEESGLVERQADPNDGRAACFYLTAVSQEAMQRMAKAGLAGMKMFLDQLTGEEQETLYGLLEKAVSGVEQSTKQSKNDQE
jgi:DNA-binding MarR family transcriptional regulator